MNPEDVNLYLVGFMGTGKTTVGRTVAHRLGFKCIDSDHEIERRVGKSIPEIFAGEGEARFRESSANSSRGGTSRSALWSPAGEGLSSSRGCSNGS